MPIGIACLLILLFAASLLLLFILVVDYLRINHAKGCPWHIFIRKKIFIEDGCTYYECPKCKLREGYLYAHFGTINKWWLNGGPQKRPTHDAEGKPIPPSLAHEVDVPSFYPFRPKNKPAQ